MMIWLNRILFFFICVVFFQFAILSFKESNQKLISNAEASRLHFQEPKQKSELRVTVADDENQTPSENDLVEYDENAGDLVVQSVLNEQKSVVVSGTMDGIIKKMPFNNGDTFKKGDILASYDCRLEKGRLRELEARMRISDRQYKASKRMKADNTIADIDYVRSKEALNQDKALVEQARVRVDLCVIRAPFDGRVKEKIASTHEAARAGRVLMEIGSLEPLQAELLVPSIWLRWLNVGTPLKIFVSESNKEYKASIVRIHGQVDPVTRTAHVVAQINKYEEELLPGMSGNAIFNANSQNEKKGYMGLNVDNLLKSEE